MRPAATTPKVDGAQLVWLRRELRLRDNPALLAAAGSGPVVPIYVWEWDAGHPWETGPAARWWLLRSLQALDTDLRTRGSRLVVRRGPAPAALAALGRETSAARLHFTPTLDPGDLDAAALAGALRSDGAPLTVEAHAPNLLFADLATARGRPYLVFAPFWKACLAAGAPPPPSPAPVHLPAPAAWPEGVSLDEVEAGVQREWMAGVAACWQPGEAAAAARLARFPRRALAGYERLRDVPAAEGTSRLSPHLHFGEVSARDIWHALNEYTHRPQPAPNESQTDARQSARAFLRQLAWREFAHQLLLFRPETPERPLRDEFEAFPWREDEQPLRLWQLGLTGYPLVDAGMRQLWATGWMHNRVRLVSASLLVKHLLQPWQLGAQWFWQTLLDADLADNTLGWQWVAGCGADAAPYFRVFSPEAQGRRVDADGAYVRRWLPELARLPDAFIHAPWTAPAHVRAAAGVRLVPPETAAVMAAGAHGPLRLPGGAYPEPIIDHGVARRRALEAFAAMRARRAG